MMRERRGGEREKIGFWGDARYPRRLHRCRKRTRRRVAVRHACTGWGGKDEMRYEMTILPLPIQRKHRHNHRVSLLLFPRTQQATMLASPMGGPRTMQVPQSVTVAGFVFGVGRFFEINSSLHGRSGSIATLHPTIGISDRLRGGGSPRQYFEGFESLEKTFLFGT
jgi:hypothetical protein